MTSKLLTDTLEAAGKYLQKTTENSLSLLKQFTEGSPEVGWLDVSLGFEEVFWAAENFSEIARK